MNHFFQIRIKNSRMQNSVFLLVLFLVTVMVMTVSRERTIDSCLDGAAKREAERQYRKGRLTQGQLVAAMTCNIHATAEGADVPQKDISQSVSTLFGLVANRVMIGLLDPSSRSEVAAMLSKDPRVDNLRDLDATGLLLFGIDTNAAIRAYERANSIEPHDMEALNRLGQLYYRQNRYSQSKQAYLRVIREDTSASRWRASALLNIGNVYYSLDDFPSAEVAYRQGAKVCTMLSRQTCATRALANLGELETSQYRKTGNPADLDAARAATLRSLAVFRATEATSDIAANVQTLAGIESLSGHLGAARHHAQEALNLFLSLGDAEGVVLGRGVLGEIAIKQGDLTAATAAFRTERREAAEQKMPNEAAESFADMGLVALAMHRPADACRMFANAAAAWRAAGLDTLERHSAEAEAQDAHCLP